MIDFEFLRERQIEGRCNAVPIDGACERFVYRNDRLLHLRRFVVGSTRGGGHADRKRRPVIEEERIEVIAVENHDRLRLYRLEMPGDLCVEPRYRRPGAFLRDACGKRGCVRNAEGSDDLRHVRPRLPYRRSSAAASPAS